MKPSFYDCRQTWERLYDYLDRELKAEEVKHVEEHLAICEICAAEYRFESALLLKLRAKAGRAVLTPELRASFMKLLDLAKSDDG